MVTMLDGYYAMVTMVTTVTMVTMVTRDIVISRVRTEGLVL